MANVLYEESDVQDIADAIREQNGSTETYTVSEMGDAVRSLGTPIDSELSETSTNPVQNKVVTAKFNELSATIDDMKEDIENVGSPTDEQIQTAVDNYLDENPVSGTTEVKKMATTHPIGELFETEYKYNSWVHNNVKYDSVNDKVVVLWSASSGHTETDRRIMMAKINPRTFKTESIGIVYDNDGVGANVATYGFEILDDGTYLTFISVYGSELEHYGKVVACKSSDYGDTWTFTEVVANNLPSNASYEFFGLTKLSTGRLLMIEYNTRTFMYSDNGGTTWECTTTSQKLHEPCFIEHSDGKTIVCYGRKTMYGTSNGAWNGTKQIEPALWWISTDGGATWTAKGDSSTITEMTSSNCCASVNDGYIDLYVCSRLPHGDAFGVIYHYYASEDDAINDNWGTPKVALYPSCATGQDFSYIGCCLDSDKNTHIFYYDSDGVEGETGIYYMIASKNSVNIPVNADNTGVLALPYSMAKVDYLLQKLNATLTAKINKIVIQGGGNVGGGDNPDSGEDSGDDIGTVMYTTDGLGEWWDFTDSSLYSEEDATYTGVMNDTVIYASNAGWGVQELPDKTYTPDGLRCYAGTYNIIDLSEDYPFANGTSFEITQVVETAHSSTSTTTWLAWLCHGNNYGSPQFNSCKNIYNCNPSFTTGNSNDEYLKTGLKHWVLTMDETEFKLYLNGKLVTSKVLAELTDYTGLSYEGLGKFVISARTEGYTTTCRVYKKVLSAEEVSNNYEYEKVMFG